MSARGRAALGFVVATLVVGGSDTALADGGPLDLSNVTSTAQNAVGQVTGKQQGSGGQSAEQNTTSQSSAGGVTQTVSNAVDTVTSTASSATEAVDNTTGSAVQTVTDATAPVVQGAVDTVAPVVQAVEETTAPAVQTVVDTAAPVVDTVTEAAAPVVQTVTKTGGDALSSAGSAVSGGSAPTRPSSSTRGSEVTPDSVSNPSSTQPAVGGISVISTSPRASAAPTDVPAAPATDSSRTATVVTSHVHSVAFQTTTLANGGSRPATFAPSVSLDRRAPAIGTASGAHTSPPSAARAFPPANGLPGSHETPNVVPPGLAFGAGVAAAVLFLFLVIQGPGRSLRPDVSPPWSPPLLTPLERPG